MSISASRLETSIDLSGSRIDAPGSAAVACAGLAAGGVFIGSVFGSDDDDFASTAGWGAALIGFMKPRLIAGWPCGQKRYINSNSLRIQTVKACSRLHGRTARESSGGWPVRRGASGEGPCQVGRFGGIAPQVEEPVARSRRT